MTYGEMMALYVGDPDLDKVYFDDIDVVFHTQKLSEEVYSNFISEVESELRLEDAQYYEETEYTFNDFTPNDDYQLYGRLSEVTIENIFDIACKYDVDYTER